MAAASASAAGGATPPAKPNVWHLVCTLLATAAVLLSAFGTWATMVFNEPKVGLWLVALGVMMGTAATIAAKVAHGQDLASALEQFAGAIGGRPP